MKNQNFSTQNILTNPKLEILKTEQAQLCKMLENTNLAIDQEQSEESKEKMRQSRLGRKFSQETREKLKQIALNRSPELLRRMADAQRAAFAKRKEKSNVYAL